MELPLAWTTSSPIAPPARTRPLGAWATISMMNGVVKRRVNPLIRVWFTAPAAENRLFASVTTPLKICPAPKGVTVVMSWFCWPEARACMAVPQSPEFARAMWAERSTGSVVPREEKEKGTATVWL